MIFRNTVRSHVCNNKYQVKKHESHAEETFSNTFTKNRLQSKPVCLGIIAKPEDHLYSSATNYVDLENLIEVTITIKQ
jgi:hypothetical protein